MTTGLGASGAWKQDRRFFTTLAALIACVAFAGFAPTYFLRSWSGRPALSGLLHVHGFLFTSWVVLFVVQVQLVAARRVDIHRRLGWIGTGLAAAMIVAGVSAAIDALRRASAPPGIPADVFFVVPMFDIAEFATLVGLAVYFRRRADFHRRLMLVGTLVLLPAAFARLPGVAAAGPVAFFGLLDLVLVGAMLYDKLTLGRVHTAYRWAISAVILSQPLRLAIGGTHAWRAFAAWVTA